MEFISKIITTLYTIFVAYIVTNIFLVIITTDNSILLDNIYSQNIVITEIYSSTRVDDNKVVYLTKTDKDTMVYIYCNDDFAIKSGDILNGKILNLSEDESSLYYLLWYGI